ncbi:MAG: FG-GAP-like repeat-containing protein [Kofleriaceae bacterium]
MRAWLLVLVAAGGCGACGSAREGAPLGRASELAIVAHQDDDLLFMQPDLHDAARAGGLVTIYVTAGNGRGGTHEADLRYAGLMHAYTVVTGADGWRCGGIEIAEHAAQHCRLDAADLSLVFLGYPDGGKEGEVPASLLHLWQGDITSATTVAHREATYTRADLIETIAAAIDLTQPRVVRTLELASTHGRDHSDHMIVGALAMLATAASHQHPELVSYRGYSIDLEPVTAIEPLFQRSRAALVRYEACATGCALCGDACTQLPESHDAWLRRRYAVGIRRAVAGVLRAADGTCLVVDARDALALGECAAATRVELATDGTLRLATARCLEVQGRHVIASSDCTPVPGRRVFLDDEGHLWLGAPPPPEPAMAVRHALCLDKSGEGRTRSGAEGAAESIDNQLVVALCGAGHAPVWELVHELSRRPRPVGFGHDVRFADIDGDRRADLCAVVAGELRCAKATADGFADATTIAALAIEPASLVLADLDGDGVLDACGRTADGIACTSQRGVAAWTPALAGTLAATDVEGDGRAELCGITSAGVTCAARGGAARPLAAWAERPAPVWLGDLDGDRRGDVCVSGPAGIECSRAADHGLTTALVPWSFAMAGKVDGVPQQVALGGIADLDGDGRGDLCRLEANRIACARSQGHGFGPAFTLATLTAPGVLLLGDVDGDGLADACVDDGSTIACTHSR